MASSFANPTVSRHHLLPENAAGSMAKANLRKAEERDWRADLGQAIERVKNMSGLSLKQFADAIDREDRQVARWITGAERPQFDAIFAVEALRQPLIVALAELAGAGVELETVIRVRRSA